MYTAISRKVVGKSARDNPERYCGWFWVHRCSKKFERLAREVMDVCLRVLNESNKSRFDSYSVSRNSCICNIKQAPLVNKLPPTSPGWRYSGFQVMGMIEWGQKSKPKEIPRASNKTPKKSLDQKLTPQKSHAEFLNLKKFEEGFKRYNTKKYGQ